MKNPVIICRNTSHGKLTFYLLASEGEYYLFQEPYRKTTDEVFRRGITVDMALSLVSRNMGRTITKIGEKLPSYLRYIESEYGVTVLRKTAKREAVRRIYSAGAEREAS